MTFDNYYKCINNIRDFKKDLIYEANYDLGWDVYHIYNKSKPAYPEGMDGLYFRNNFRKIDFVDIWALKREGKYDQYR